MYRLYLTEFCLARFCRVVWVRLRNEGAKSWKHEEAKGFRHHKPWLDRVFDLLPRKGENTETRQSLVLFFFHFICRVFSFSVWLGLRFLELFCKQLVSVSSLKSFGTLINDVSLKNLSRDKIVLQDRYLNI